MNHVRTNETEIMLTSWVNAQYKQTLLDNKYQSLRNDIKQPLGVNRLPETPKIIKRIQQVDRKVSITTNLQKTPQTVKFKPAVTSNTRRSNVKSEEMIPYKAKLRPIPIHKREDVIKHQSNASNAETHRRKLFGIHVVVKVEKNINIRNGNGFDGTQREQIKNEKKKQLPNIEELEKKLFT